MADEPNHEQKEDVVVLHSPTEDGAGVRVVRLRNGGVELGEVRQLQEGKPVDGDVVTLTPRAKSPRVCDVKVHLEKSAARGGPAQVATTTYRTNWEATFGGTKREAELN